MRTKGPRIISVLTTKLTILMRQLQGYIQSQKLSGQVLHVRTGVLRASVNAIPTTFSGTSIIGGVDAAASDSPAFYGAVHEFGGKSAFDILPVKARALSFLMNGKQVAFAKVHREPLPARPFMRPSLEENAEKIRASLQEAVREAIENG